MISEYSEDDIKYYRNNNDYDSREYWKWIKCPKCESIVNHNTVPILYCNNCGHKFKITNYRTRYPSEVEIKYGTGVIYVYFNTNTNEGPTGEHHKIMEVNKKHGVRFF